MSRTAVVLVLTGLGVLTFGASLLTWIQADALTPLGPRPVRVSGAEAVPVVPSATLVILVAGLAMGLSGKVVRYLAPAAAVLAAAAALIALTALLRDPFPAARSAAGELGGVREIVGTADLTPWPWVSAVLLVLTALAAAAVPFLAGSWAPAARKYERAPAPAPADEAHSPRSDWDALSSGHDPSVEDPGAEPASPADPPPTER